jgi:protein translocase SecG subunit
MKTFLLIFQIVVSVLLSLSILLQDKGTGLSATFGGQGGFYASKRGADKFLEIATIILAVLFVGSALAFLYV